MRAIATVIFVQFCNLALGGKLVTSPGLKIWRANINLTNPSDWDGGALPRPCDRAVIPAMTSLSMNLASSLEVQELVLPLDGEIVLSEGGSLVLGNPNSNCRFPKDVRYVPPSPGDWYEPSSWIVPEEQKENRTIPIPESERVPCQYDDIEFPVNSTYKAAMGGPEITVKSFLIDGKAINDSSVFRALKSTESGRLRFGRLRFSSNKPVRITNLTCADDSGCVCRKEDRLDLICKLAKCNDIDCTDPVKPIGGCCNLCGAYIIVNCKNDFELSRLKKLYDTYINKDEYKNVYGYLSKLSDNRAQVVLEDDLETHRASVLAIELANVLRNDVSGVGIYGISSVELQISSHWLIHEKYTSVLSIGGVFGLSILFVFILFLSLSAYVACHKYGFFNLSYGQFQDEKDDADGSDDEPVITAFAPEGAGIENPLYEKEIKKDLSTEILDSADVELEESPAVVSTETRENPAFMVFEELKHLQDESFN